MDTTNRRPQLPALSYLDIDKQKREEAAYADRNTGAAQHAPTASPVSQYPSGPPPPYSHSAPQLANTWSGVKPTAHTPPESRRTSSDDNENTKQSVRQSLPSISEALGVESQTTYPQSLPTSHPPSHSTHVSQPQAAAPPSPSAARRTYAMEPPHQPSYGNTQSYSLSSFRQDSAGPQSYQQPEIKPLQTSQTEARPPLHVQTSQPPPRDHLTGVPSYQPPASSHYEQPSSHSAGSMGPPSFPYGYTPYPPRYAQPAAPNHASGPIYQPSTQFAAPSTPSSTWKSESGSSRYEADDRAPAPSPYSESVKRHLDLFDLEEALREIAQTSGIVTDFSRRYGDRLHQTARSVPSLSTLPSIVEVEDMITKSRLQVESLAKIREVILTQQAAYEQQLVDQRQQQQHHKVFAEPPSQPLESHPDVDDSYNDLSGSDAKKPRRGRAAPPGRCHSCNRAETPEWRRGPDGARTLCNACGLHYAKLTRKQTGANKNANVGSSNLRPKEA